MQDRFSVMPCRIHLVPLLPLLRFISLFDSLLTLTRHFHSLNLLFPLLVFVFTSHSHASYCYCLSCFVPTLFNRRLAFFVVIACFLPCSSYYTIAVCTRALIWGRCESRDLRGWNEHIHVSTSTNSRVTHSCMLPYL